MNSDLELVVESDFIYLPLLFDPEIEKEAQALLLTGRTLEKSGKPGSNTIIHFKDRHFVKALRIDSLLENFEAINEYDYKQIKNDCLRKYYLSSEIDTVFIDETLRNILFHMMPYFVRKDRGLQRKKLSNEEILDLISEKVDIPPKYFQDAKTFRDLRPLREILRNLEDQKPICKPLGNGLVSTRRLRDWLLEAIQAKILADEHVRIAKTLQVREKFCRAKPEHIAIMLYIADAGAMEIDGFGFTKNSDYRGYLVYKRTGEYILKDYYARNYLFPDCSVAVSTAGPMRPIVIETYKHPFLYAHDSGQEICMRSFNPPKQFTVNNAITVLEEGINALLYGYDSRRRNGIHSLDHRRVHVKGIEFDDYRI